MFCEFLAATGGVNPNRCQQDRSGINATYFFESREVRFPAWGLGHLSGVFSPPHLERIIGRIKTLADRKNIIFLRISRYH